MKQYLLGDLLANIVSDLDAFEENYNIAWGLIQDRCDKPRKIINSFLKELLQLPTINKLSPASIWLLKERSLVNVNALKALKVKIEHWNPI